MMPIFWATLYFGVRSSTSRCLASADRRTLVCCFVIVIVRGRDCFCVGTNMTEEEDSSTDKQIVSVVKQL